MSGSGNVLVAYTSKYGSARRYAEWIAEALGTAAVAAKDVDAGALAGYDVVVYGGGLYAGGIAGCDLVTKNPVKRLVLFTVGLADPASTSYEAILAKNVPEALRARTPVFHLRGGIDYGKLGPVHRAMMAMMRRMVAGKVGEDPDAGAFLATYGKKVDFSDRGSIAGIVACVAGLREEAAACAM